ncbi:MAG: hypothetical protein L3J41_15590 [Melioribacteraceae bacterium]|nr:hypothetical protein [Melioribacteraceae bacterium]
MKKYAKLFTLDLNSFILKLYFIISIIITSFTSAQDVAWSSMLSVTPIPSPYISDWERNPAIGSFTVSYMGTSAKEYLLEYEITSSSVGTIVDGVSSKFKFLSANSRVFTLLDVLVWGNASVNQEVVSFVMQTGMLPEGDYVLCIKVIDINKNLLTEACSNFDVVLPGPPQLIIPEDEAVVDINQPNFIWNPVNVPPPMQPVYHLRLVELIKGQTKYRAIEANYPHQEAEIIMSNSYLYPIDALPLEKGKTYVWQITAKDEDGKTISLNDGKSEIWEFSYGSAKGSLKIDTLVLVPNVASLINLQNLTSADNSVSLTLDGSCDLLLTLPDNSTKHISVSVQSLSVHKGDYTNPLYLSGSVTGAFFTGDLPKSLTGNFFQPKTLQFTAPNQFAFNGNFVFGTNTDVPLIGYLTYDGSQLSGSLSGTGTEQTPLFKIGDNNFYAAITSLNVTFPSLDFTLTGAMAMFGSSSGCTLNNILLKNNGDFNVSVSCAPNKDIPLIPGTTLFNLNLTSSSGKFSGNLLNAKLSYDVNIAGGLLFKPSGGNSFGAQVTLRLQPNNFQLVNFNSNINMNFASIDLGWLKWKLSNLQVKKLTYIDGKWDFDIRTDMKFSFPDFFTNEIPTIPNISFKPDGFTFPKLDLTNFSIPDINFGAFNMALEGFHISPFTFNWSKWSPGDIANMSFSWDVKFNMPNLPAGTPDALKNLNLKLKPTIVNGNFSVQIPKINFPTPLSMPLISGINFNVSELEGILKTVYNGTSMVFSPDIKFEGDIDLPSVFSCESGTPKINVKIGVDGKGRMNGTIQNLVPQCPLVIGAAKLQVKSSKVEFKYDTTQKISIDGSAGIYFDNKEVGTLALGYEILHNNLYKLEGDITDPFNFNIPTTNPVLSFLIKSASVKDKILTVDGRHKFNFDNGTNMGVTFDKFQIGLTDFSHHGGRVLFDTPFNLVISDLSGALNFKTVPNGTAMTANSGIMIALPSSIELNKQGLKIKGNGTAEIKFNGKQIASISAKFSNDFAFGLSPFAITDGKCEFFYNNQRVAYVNKNGFFPDPNFFLNAVLPEKIPLPLLDIAYLKIKNADKLLVNVTEKNGLYEISTKTGEPVSLFFPGLKFTNPVVPELKVNFSIKYNSNTKQITDGSISATPPSGVTSPFDLSQYGIPFKIDTLFYGKINGSYAFRLHGLLKLFDKEFSQSNAINLFIGRDGKLVSNLNMKIQQTIPIVPGSDKINLKFKKLNGSFNVDLLSSNINFSLSLDSEIKIKVDAGKEVGATATIEARETGISVKNYKMDVSALGEIGMDYFKMAIKKINMPKLEYKPLTDPNPGWDFEFNLDLDLQFPGLGFKIPEIKGITLTKNGFHFPQLSIPKFPDNLKFQFMGFEFKPLAFRTPKIDFNWFSDNPVNSNWDFKFDFAINFPNIANGGGLMKTPNLTITNAGYKNGILIGNVTKSFNNGDISLRFGGSSGFSVTKITGGLYNNSGSQGVKFGLNGFLELPDFMQCSNTKTADISSVSFELDSKGLIAGRVNNFIPTCPLDLGFGKFNITSSKIDFSIVNNSQSAVLDMAGNLVMPTGQGNNVTANGALKLNLITGEIVDGDISIKGPFAWSIPYDKPLFKFTINSAKLNKNGLMINGSSQLLLEGGASQTVQFNNFIFDYMNSKVKGGNITIAGNIGLKLNLPQNGGINWAIIGKSDPLTTDRSAMIGFGGTVTIDKNGVSTSGTATAAIRWDASHTYNGLSVAFSNDFALKLNPFEVSKGKADLKLNSDIIAYLDNGGFHLGNIFGIIPLPEKLPIPDINIAYIKIKNGNTVLLETNQKGSDLQLKTRAGKPVKLLIPALKKGAKIPEFDVTFDITVNTSTWSLVSGEISVEAAAGNSLLDLQALLGIPVKIEKVSYGKVNGSYKFAADAKLSLPQALGGLPIDLKGLSFDQNGITGKVNIGQYSQTMVNKAKAIAGTNLGNEVKVVLEGASAQFGTTKAFKFSGKIIPLMLKKGTDTTKIHYAAEWNFNSNEFVFAFDFTQGEKFNFGLAEFYPQAIKPDPAMKLTFSGSNFEFKLGGTLKVPKFDPNFAIAFKGFKINNSGVSVDAVNISDVNKALTFKLFNSQFRIYDSYSNSEAISFAYQSKVLSLTLTGDIKVLDRVVKFKGFKIATDGKISIQNVNLLDNELVLIKDYLSLDTLGIKNVNNNYRLQLAGNMKLPKSIAQTSSFHFGFEIGTDGKIYSNTTDNRIVLINEKQGLGKNDKSEYKFWEATIDPTYLDLGLNFSDMKQSYVSFLGDIYWGNKETSRVEFGKRKADGTINQPAFKVTFDGKVSWGDITVKKTISFDWAMLKLGINSLSVQPTDDNIFITLGGYFGLNISSVTGMIEIEGLKISNSGVDDFGKIKKAQLKIASIVDLQLTDIVYKDKPTTITVKSGEMPGNGSSGSKPSAKTEEIKVKNYFSFGGKITIANILSGGIKNFVTYTTMDDNFNLLIEDAFIKYSDVFELNMDLVYKTQGSEYYLFAGAKGKIMSYAITVVGEAGNFGGVDRFGFFIAVDVTIPIGPVVISGLGGGFFYNPKEETINSIKRLARLDDTGGTNNKIKPGTDNTKFAIFLFGKFALVNDKIIVGRVLLTLTDKQFYLDGKVVMLDQKNSIYGTIHLAVNFNAGEFEGNIKINVKMVSVIVGKGKISAYIYNENTWGVMGKTDIKVLNIIDVKSEFFVGPNGFLVSFSAVQSFNIWIINLEGGFAVKVWYIQNVSWGLYAKVWIKVEVLGGVAGAEGWLKGALFGANNDFYMYGVAGLKIHLTFIKWKGSVWGKIKNGNTSGGFGSDSDMEKLIEDAGKTSKKAEQAKNDMKNNINSHPVPTVPTRNFSDAELASAFDNLSKWGKLITYGNVAQRVAAVIVLGVLQSIEENGRYYNYTRTTAEKNVEDYSLQTYTGVGAPNLGEMQKKGEFIDSLFTQFSSARSNMLNKLNKSMESIELLPINIKEAGGSPVTSENFTTIKRDANGSILNQPNFQFDESIADRNKNNLKESQQEIAQYEKRLFERIGKIDKNISSIEEMLFGQTSTYEGKPEGTSGSVITSDLSGGMQVASGGSGVLTNTGLTLPNTSTLGMLVPIDRGAEGFSEGYASYFNSIDVAYVSQYKYYKSLENWASNRQSYFANTSKFGNFESALAHKANQIYQSDWRGVKYLTGERVYFLSYLSNNDSQIADQEKQKILSQYDSEKSSKTESVFKAWAIKTNTKYGMNLWVDIPKVGLLSVIDTSRARALKIKTTKVNILENLARMQASLTQKMNGLYSHLAKFVELKYDLYSRLVERRRGVTEYLDNSVTTSYLKSQKVVLGNRMKLPTISSLTYMATDEGYYSDVKLSWSITGTGGQYAKAMIDYSSSNPYIKSSGKQAIGGLKNFRIMYIPNTVTSSGGNFGITNFSLNIKNGLGYSIGRNVSFTPVCSGTATSSGGGSAGSTSADTTPPLVNKAITYPYLDNRVGSSANVPRIYYTSNTSTVSASWSAWDNQSGIREYRYTLISSTLGNIGSGGTTLLGGSSTHTLSDNLAFISYSGLGGANTPFDSWTNNFGRNNIEIHGLHLKHNNYYQLYVVAQNGDKLWSTDTIGVKQYLLVDTTPPEAPQPKSNTVLGGSTYIQGDYIDGGHRYPGNDNTQGGGLILPGGFGGGTIIGGASYTVNPPIPLPANVGGYSISNRTSGLFPLSGGLDNSNISEVFSWEKASDQESGIYSYEYRITKKDDPSKVSSWIDVGNNLSVTLLNSTTGMNNIMTYLDTLYLDVRSVNRAKKQSDKILRFHFQPIDKTAPSKPDVNMAYSSNHLKVFLIFNQMSSDPETGLNYYEVAVGSKANGTFDYVSWDNSLNINPKNIGSNNEYLLPVLPNNSVSYIAIRAVNKQGMKGDICYTGPFYNDTTPPITPSVAASSMYMNNNVYMALLFNSLQDPETGILSVEYKIEKVTYTTTSGNSDSVTTVGSGSLTGFGNGGTLLYGGGGALSLPSYQTLVDWTTGSADGSYFKLDNVTRNDRIRISVRSKNGALLYSPVFSTQYLIP